MTTHIEPDQPNGPVTALSSPQGGTGIPEPIAAGPLPVGPGHGEWIGMPKRSWSVQSGRCRAWSTKRIPRAGSGSAVWSKRKDSGLAFPDVSARRRAAPLGRELASRVPAGPWRRWLWHSFLSAGEVILYRRFFHGVPALRRADRAPRHFTAFRSTYGRLLHSSGNDFRRTTSPRSPSISPCKAVAPTAPLRGGSWIFCCKCLGSASTASPAPPPAP